MDTIACLYLSKRQLRMMLAAQETSGIAQELQYLIPRLRDLVPRVGQPDKDEVRAGILLVAKEGSDADWACYCLPAFRYDLTEHQIEEVERFGAKLSKRHAQLLFPWVSLGYRE